MTQAAFTVLVSSVHDDLVVAKATIETQKEVLAYSESQSACSPTHPHTHTSTHTKTHTHPLPLSPSLFVDPAHCQVRKAGG